MKQAAFEMMYHQENNTVLLEAYKDSMLVEPLAYIQAWLAQPHELFKEDGALREDTHQILTTVINGNHEDILFRLMCQVILSNGGVTAQQLVGSLFNSFKNIEIHQRRLRVIEVYLMAMEQSPMINYRKVGDYHMYETDIKLNDKMLGVMRKQGYPLPALEIGNVTSNQDIGYRTHSDHVISGNHVKRHDKDVCLEHINRLNSVMCKVETRVGFMSAPVFSFKPKFNKKTSMMETAEEVQQRYASFLELMQELPEKIDIMVSNGNAFYFKHRYDSRLRTYKKAHHFNTMGHKYCKSIVQLKGGAIAEGTDKYL